MAAAAALMISANPSISAATVREILGSTAKMLRGQKAWTEEFGWGRLDIGKAVGDAKAAGTGLPPKAPTLSARGAKSVPKRNPASKVARQTKRRRP